MTWSLSLLAGVGACCHAPAHTPTREIGQPIAFAIKNLPVKVVNIQPNAIKRGAFGGCETFSAWRPELVAALVAFVKESLIGSTDRIVSVSVYDAKARESLGVQAALQPHEFGVAIDPGTLIVYDHDRADSYCITVVEQNDLLVKLDLFNVSEGHPHILAQ